MTATCSKPTRIWFAFIVTLMASMVASVALAVPLSPDAVKDRLEPKPDRLEAVDLQEKLGGQIPRDAQFTDSNGNVVTLGGLLRPERPTILTFNYADCPMLCSLQLEKFVAALGQLARVVGDEFDIVTISIDPEQTPSEAAESKARYLRGYTRGDVSSAWHFLVGPEQVTRHVAEAIGLSYTYNEARGEWLHPAVITVLTPGGTISRYLYGLEYHPETLNLAIVEASEGKIGTAMERLILYCFHYDESEGRYAPVAMNIMRVGAGLVALILGGFLSLYWIRELRRKRRRNSPTGSNPRGTQAERPSVEPHRPPSPSTAS